jgi:adenylyltransferase/sulfurtransferase
MSDHSNSNRYARQIQFAPIGVPGQRLLEAADVAVLGCGALGTVAAEILVRAGVGRIRLIDRDVVEWTNLQRQSLFCEVDAETGQAKADAAAARLGEINRGVAVEPLVVDVTADNIRQLLDQVDLVIDAADNFATRLLLNDWSLATETPWVHGGCVGAVGQIRLFTGQGMPCFRCLVPDVPPASEVQTCDTAGVLGAATHLVASLQAAEAIKWLSGNRAAIRQSLISLDLWRNRIREIPIDRGLRTECPACQGDYQFLDGRGGRQVEEVLCGRQAVQIRRIAAAPIDLEQIASDWEAIGHVQVSRFFVRLFPDELHSLTLFRDGRVVVTGTSEISEARSLHDRYVGG